MTDLEKTNRHRIMLENGFVPLRDETGALWFCQRDLFAELVKAGKLPAGGGYQ